MSLRHRPTGLNLTVGGVREDLERGGHAETRIVKAGWLADLVDFGPTAFSLDYYEVNDLRLEGDEGRSSGLFAIQKWPDYGLDVYVGYRRYQVDRPDIRLRDLDIFSLGAALGF